MDVMFRVPSTAPAESNHNEQDQDGDDEDSDDEDSDDEDEEYDVNLRKYNQSIQESLNFPTKSSANYNNTFNSTCKYSNFVENELDKDLRHIMRAQFRALPAEQFTYQRNEILVDNYDEYTVKTLTTKDTVPQLLYENTPLFRHYNTINGIKSMVKYLGIQAANLLVFSFHILQDCLQLFCYIYQNGKIYGSRIFTKDLFETIPRFYKDPTVHDVDKEEVLKNIAISNDLQFDDDKTYEEYKLVLYSRKAENKDQMESKLVNQLTEFVAVWNINHNFNNPLDVHELINAFESNHIDYKWLKNNCDQTAFFTILMKRQYCIPLINALWDDLTGIKYKIAEKQNAIPLDQQHAYIQLQRQVNELKARVSVQQQVIYEQYQEIEQIKNDIIFFHPNDINHYSSSSSTSSSSTSSSSGRSSLDEIANRNPYPPPSSPSPEINLPSSPMNIQKTLSFNSWNSGCDGCRISDQSSDEDNTESKYAENDDNLLQDNNHNNNNKFCANIDEKEAEHMRDMHQGIKEEIKEEIKDDNINNEVIIQPPSSPPSLEHVYSTYGKHDTLFSDRTNRYCMDVARATLRYINDQPVFENNQWTEYMESHRELVNAMIQGWIFQQLNNLSKKLNYKN